MLRARVFAWLLVLAAGAVLAGCAEGPGLVSGVDSSDSTEVAGAAWDPPEETVYHRYDLGGTDIRLWETDEGPLLVTAEGSHRWDGTELIEVAAFGVAVRIDDETTGPEGLLVATRHLDSGVEQLVAVDPVTGEVFVWYEDDRIEQYALVDVLGSDAPEIIVQSGTSFRDTGTPLDYDQRIHVLSWDGTETGELWSSTTGAHQAVRAHGFALLDSGWGDERPEIVWVEGTGEWYKSVTWRLRVACPQEGFAQTATEDRGLGVADVAGGEGLEEGNGTGVVAVDVAASEDQESRTEWYWIDETGSITQKPYSDPYVPDSFSGIRLTAPADSPVDPSAKLGHVGLIDLDGDGPDDAVVWGHGDPGLCGCTKTGYVGWAFDGHPSSLGGEPQLREAVWSPSLEAGIVGDVLVHDLDGDGTDEVIVATSWHEEGDLWIIEPGVSP